MTGMFQPAACPAEEVLKAYVDGELSTDEQSTVRAHLDGCSTCAGEVEVMKIIGSELKGLESAVEPPAGLRGRILNRIDFTPERRRRSGLGFLRWVSLAAGAVVVVCVAYNLWPSFPESASQERMAQAPATLPVMGMSPEPSALKSSDGIALRSSGPRGSAQAGGKPDYGRNTAYPSGAPANYAIVGGTAAGEPARAPGAAQSGASTPQGTVSDVDRFARGKLDEPVSRKVFQSADLSVRVDRKLESAQDEIAGHLKKLGGYVEESSLSSPEGTQERVADMVLRAPVDQFEATLSWLSGLGDVTAKSLSGKDVTGRWVDERAVLREMRKAEARLLKELDQAKKPAQIQNLRAQLLLLRPRIAAAEEQFAATSKLAALATIRLKLLERPEARVRGNLLDDMGRTTHTAWAAFLVALRVPASILIWLAVFAPLWLPCVLVYRWATKKLDEERRRARTEVYSTDPAV